LNDGAILRSYEDFSAPALGRLLAFYNLKNESRKKEDFIKIAEADLVPTLTAAPPKPLPLCRETAAPFTTENVEAVLRFFVELPRDCMKNHAVHYIFEDLSLVYDLSPGIGTEETERWVAILRQKFSARFAKFVRTQGPSPTLLTMVKREIVERLRPPVHCDEADDPLC
jgi:hypothetical protein